MSAPSRLNGHQVWDELQRAHLIGARAPDGFPVHRPKAAVLCCSDARVSPSVVLNQPAGNIFVVRVAGHAAGAVTVASLDFAVADLGVPLIVVLGHTDCGVAHAAVAASESWYLEPLVAPLAQLTETYPAAGVDEIVQLNVVRTMELLADHNGPTGQSIRNRTVDIRGAVYDIRTGKLSAIEADVSLDDQL